MALRLLAPDADRNAGSVFLLLIFPLPLAVWAPLRRLAGELETRTFVAVLTTLLVARFLMSPEVFATAAFFGAIALVLAARSASAEDLARLRSVASSIVVAYAISAVVLLPYLYFQLAGGYVGLAPPMPKEDAGWPMMSGLYNLAGVPDAANQLKAYLANHDVGAIIVGPRTQYLVLRLGNLRTAATWLRWPTIERERLATAKLLASLNTTPLEVGGITLYRIPPKTLAPYRQTTTLEMQRRAAGARFEALLLGTQRYFSQGRNPAALTPQALESLGLVPLDWFGGKPFPDHYHVGNPIFHLDSILSASNNGAIEIGIEGRYAALKPIIDRYGTAASAIYFPYPSRLNPQAASLTNNAAMMVIKFDRTGLARAAAAAASGGDGACKPPAAATAAPVSSATAPDHTVYWMKARVAQ